MRILIKLFISAVRIKFQIFYLIRELNLNNLFKYKTKMFYIILYEKFEICSQKSEKNICQSIGWIKFNPNNCNKEVLKK